MRWKLTPQQHHAIIRAYQAGDKVECIATDFGVTSTYVSRLAHRAGIDRRYKKTSYSDLRNGTTSAYGC